MQFGYCVVKQAFTREQAKKVTSDVWIRLGMDENDKGTWDKVSRVEWGEGLGWGMGRGEVGG